MIQVFNRIIVFLRQNKFVEDASATVAPEKPYTPDKIKRPQLQSGLAYFKE